MSEPVKIELEIRSESERARQERPDKKPASHVKFELPSKLKRTFWCSATLLIIGVTLIILGFFENVYGSIPGEGISFWVLGGILIIPGGYYSWQFYKAMKSTDTETRDDILDEIPQI